MYKKKKIYTKEQLQNALAAINNGMGYYSASKLYKVPKTTLVDKMHNKYPEGATPGAHTVLTKSEELSLVDWILYLSNVGFPITKSTLIDSVAKLVSNLKRENPFKNNTPGRHWYEGFLARHPELSSRVCQYLTIPRANISEESVRAWFSRVDQYLRDNLLETVLKDPRRVFNCDESAFYMCPKENQVIVKRGSNKVYSRIANDEKECLTLLVTVSADGNMQPPLVLFPYKRLPASIILKMPPKWSVGQSDSGWMTGENFYEYITNVFYSWLINNEITLPVVLFLDGHASHINLPLSEFCKDKGIILTALLPNSTHRLQPLDVAVFRPLKHCWKNHMQKWRIGNEYKKLKREDFAIEMDICLKKAATSDTIRNGFKACGLYPFNPDNIDYNKLIERVKKSTTQENETIVSAEVGCGVTKISGSNMLLEVEKRLDTVTLEEFRTTGETWEGDPKNEGLFLFWQKLNNEILESEVFAHDDTLSANMTPNILNNLLENQEILDLEVQVDGIVNVSHNKQHYSNPELINLSNMDLGSLPVIIYEENLSEKLSGDMQTKSSAVEYFNPLKISTRNTSTPKVANDGHDNEASGDQTSKMISTLPDKPTSLEETSHVASVTETGDSDIAPLPENSLCSTSDTAASLMEGIPGKPENKSPVAGRSLTSDRATLLPEKKTKTPEKTPERSLEDVDKKNKIQPHLPTPLKNVSTPFKNALFWPSAINDDKKKRLTKVTPTVAISEEFIEYQKRLDREKKKKEEDKANKLRKRKSEKEEKENAKMKKDQNKKYKENKVRDESNALLRKLGDFVIVNYEGEFFPGVITAMKNHETSVKTMAMSGLNWKWPDKDDIVGYLENEIVCNINPPVAINKRGVFSIPEITKLRNAKP